MKNKNIKINMKEQDIEYIISCLEYDDVSNTDTKLIILELRNQMAKAKVKEAKKQLKKLLLQNITQIKQSRGYAYDLANDLCYNNHKIDMELSHILNKEVTKFLKQYVD